MRKRVLFIAMLFSILVVPSLVLAVDTPIWYDVKFTGVDIWTYSANNDLQSRTDQTAPRRYRDWTGTSDPIKATTYGASGGLTPTSFNTSAGTGAGFAFDSINLWGAGGANAQAWGEKYVSVGNTDPGAEGMSSWKLISAPTDWTYGIVKGNDSWSADATHAFPVWRSGTGLTLSQANMNDSSFVWEFQVLISNPSLAFEPGGKLRVYFGGFSDDLQGAGLGNHEVSGAMNLAAAPVPIPGALLLFGSGLLGLVGIGRKRLHI